MSLGSGRCYEHPDRPGLGICVECRRVICSECTTQFEGINRCASCLNKRLAATRAAVRRQDWSVGNVLLALCALAVLYGGFYGLAALVK